MKGVWTLLSLFISVCSALYDPRDQTTLRLLHVFFRHGDRTPFQSYPNDPYNDPSYWPEGWGQLTNAGKVRLYQLGQYFRNCYKDFVPEYFRNSDIHMYSTDKARTLMSAQGFLAGLFPAEREQMWLSGMPWQPIPVHTMPVDEDPFYPVSKCPRASAELREVFALPKVKKFYKEHSQLWKYLEKESGQRLLTIIEFGLLYDTLKVQKENNMTLPNWTKGVFPEKMDEVFLFSYYLLVHTIELKRLRAGPMLGSIVNAYKSYRNGTLSPHSRRLFLHAVHDGNIMFLTSTLNVTKPFVPHYGCTVIFELHKLMGEYFVKMVLANNTDQAPEVLDIPGCLHLCPLDQFIKITTPFIPESWKCECTLQDDNSLERSFVSMWSCSFIWTGLIILIILLLTRRMF